MSKNTILLAEDSYDDEVLTLRALRKAVADVEIVVAHNGVEVLDYLCATGAHHGRDLNHLPKLLLLDLKMPMMDGLETLRRVRATEHASLLPVVILTSSDERRDQIESYRQERTVTCASRSGSRNSSWPRASSAPIGWRSTNRHRATWHRLPRIGKRKRQPFEKAAERIDGRR